MSIPGHLKSRCKWLCWDADRERDADLEMIIAHSLKDPGDVESLIFTLRTVC